MRYITLHYIIFHVTYWNCHTNHVIESCLHQEEYEKELEKLKRLQFGRDDIYKWCMVHRKVFGELIGIDFPYSCDECVTQFEDILAHAQ